MLRLDHFTGTYKVKADGECKRLDNWTFVSDTFGRSGGKIVLHFEDGTQKEVQSLENVENCGK